MTRIRKNHDERLTEILDATEKLFISKSYELTTINDILAAVNIGKGTFYHYFKSKEEVMAAVIKRLTDDLASQTMEIANDSVLSAHEKMKRMLQSLNINQGDTQAFVAELNHPSNAKMHELSLHQINETIAPILAQVVIQGIDEGVYQTDYPLETIEGFIILSQYMIDNAIPSMTLEQLMRRAKALVTMITLSLGAENGSFDFLLADFESSQLKGVAHDITAHTF